MNRRCTDIDIEIFRMFLEIDRHPSHRPIGTSRQRGMLAMESNYFLGNINRDLRWTTRSFSILNPVPELKSVFPTENGFGMESQNNTDSRYTVLFVKEDHHL